MKVLIAGGAGFTSPHLAKLLSWVMKLRVLDDPSSVFLKTFRK